MKGSSPASFEKKINAKTVCDACQQAKSHQLPYPVPNSISKAPLDLVFSDVWGPAIDSSGRKNYYVILLMITVNLYGLIC
jgi:hypothetical protein